ncbi:MULTISPECIES: competence/damage-inducible protein A [Pontibacillus]|uniref:Putative competence-damage inducible protein n=1 Tax=Pontibacillus chungwhensis TaxID=265426 RepID=A0ABY8V3J9_9BACI|nr:MULTISPECIES: competence/damage-inducible protein A [Pontibacillus]MCD5322757.1 competence/damage-inducible protein A [Pontibacillus sp. HN14]WIG00029.1 competence/damage-inducible protein A [Pontibacillus chungwhensis]
MTQLVKGEIIAVGTELLLGQIVNSNAQWVSQELANRGVGVFYHTVVGDNLNRLQSQFKESAERSDLVIITGGLGPTDDDLTREAAAKVMGKEIVQDDEALASIESYYARNNQQMTPNNKRQARIIEGGVLLSNRVGMAPGFAVQDGDTLWVFLPGVPREMKAILQDDGFKYIEKHFSINQTIKSRMLRFIGIGESQLEHDLKDLIDGQTNPTIAPLASAGEVGLRLTARADDEQVAVSLIEKAEREIKERVGEYFYGTDDDSIQSKVMELLKENNLSISAAESLTGGRFVDNIVSFEGASSICKGGIVAYSNEAKENVLDIPSLVLEEYGAVSEACALSMAVNITEKLRSDIGISFTGVAGPTASEGKEVGTVYIGIYVDDNQPIVKCFHFNGDRDMIRHRSVKKGFELLYYLLKS